MNFSKTGYILGVCAMSLTPLNQIAQDEEIAAAVAFLVMEKASYTTGQNLSINGGVTTGLL